MRQQEEQCFDCGDENPVWFTDNVFWNTVMDKDKQKIVCVGCFTIRAEKIFKVTGWRIIPEFKWEACKHKLNKI